MSINAARHSCSFFLARLEGEIGKLREFSFPGHHTGPRKWLNFISGVLDTASQYLEASQDQALTTDQASKLVREAETLGHNAYKFLQYVSGADAAQIPHQVVAPFQRWVDALGIKNTIFFRAEHQPNYELSWYDASSRFMALNSPSQSLIEAFNKISWPILRVTVPSQAMGMLPHFAVVGHELGHAIQDQVKPNLSAHDAVLQDCYTQLQARLLTAGIPKSASIDVRINQILSSWVNEIKADAIGYYIVGPAFFFALCGFLELAGHGYGISPTHPPSDMRRKLLVAQLSAGSPSFVEVFERRTGLKIEESTNSPHVLACPQTEPLFLELETVYSKVDAAICAEFVPYAQTVAPDIFAASHSYLTGICPDLVYSPELLDFDLQIHLDGLCALVPPIEHWDKNAGKPVPSGFTSVLNVGWAALLTRLEQIPSAPIPQGGEASKKMERLHELLLKAVELSEARRLWEEHQ